jgi:hypothetical protein
LHAQGSRPLGRGRGDHRRRGHPVGAIRPGSYEPARASGAIWDSLQIRELAVRACFDCHSNQTVWPWYSNIAPISWLIQRDVDEGRRKTNFSEWDQTQREARESAETVQKGTMLPWYYPWARFSPTERHNLIRGLAITVGQEPRGTKEQEGQERR